MLDEWIGVEWMDTPYTIMTTTKAPAVLTNDQQCLEVEICV